MVQYRFRSPVQNIGQPFQEELPFRREAFRPAGLNAALWVRGGLTWRPLVGQKFSPKFIWLAEYGSQKLKLYRTVLANSGILRPSPPLVASLIDIPCSGPKR